MLEPADPASYARLRIGDVIERANDRRADPARDGLSRFVGVDHLDSGELRLRRWSEVDKTELPPTFRYAFAKGAVLFPTRRPALRKCVVAPFDGITGEKILILNSADESRLDPDFMPFLLASPQVRDWVIERAIGSVTPHFRWRDLSEFEFLLPPLEQQKHIAATLLAVEREREALSRCQASVDALNLSIANEIFSKHGWPTRQLSDVLVHASDGPFGSKIKTEHYCSTGVRVIRLQNIDSNAWNDADKAFVSKEYFERALNSYEVRAGDVIMAGLGDERIPAGRACVVPTSATPALNKADCFCLRPDGTLSASFLSLFLNSPVGLRQAARFAQGTTRQRLNLGNIKRMSIPTPSLEAQERIVSQIKSISNASQSIRTKMLRVSEVRSSLLGRVIRVSDDV